MKRCALSAALLALALLAPAPDVSIAVEGRYGFEPATVRLRVRVEPDSRNRGLAYGVDSADFVSSSWEDLPGERAPITRWATYRDLPAGEYIAYAEVVRPANGNRKADTRFRILERGF